MEFLNFSDTYTSYQRQTGEIIEQIKFEIKDLLLKSNQKYTLCRPVIMLLKSSQKWIEQTKLSVTAKCHNIIKLWFKKKHELLRYWNKK